ncbi:MAG TPA: hypothetical protein VH325_15435 [Bryobacteraceae bacterium]|jgi:hypothetical protein|nr:hypothetical protein [Bryobacteraceae bacterium]
MTLALGIGANTTIFTLVHQLILRLLPIKDLSGFLDRRTMRIDEHPKMRTDWALMPPIHP